MELLRELEIPLYIRRVKMSDKRRATYYEKGKKNKLPLKYTNDPKRYVFLPHRVGKRVVVYLTDTTTNQRVVKNSKSVGTPRYKVINGQYIYDGSLVKEARNKVLQTVKGFFSPFVDALEPIPLEDFPIRIEVELHYPMLADNGMPWDIDNHFYIYQKAFQDVLTGHRDKDKKPRNKIIIPEDDNLFVSKPPSPLHIPVATVEERKLVVRIYKENDPRILNFPGRKELFTKYANTYDDQYRPIRR